MHSRSLSGSRYEIQPLESRRLLTVAPAGAEVAVPLPVDPPLFEFDMAVGGGGSFIVVSDPFGFGGAPVIAVRYSAAGEQVGGRITIDDAGFNAAVSMDADGDAVVAYQPDLTRVDIVRIARTGAVSASQQIDTVHARERISDVRVSMDDAGGFFVAWTRETDVGEVFQYARAFDAAGQPRGPRVEVRIGGIANPHSHLGIAALRDGSGAIVTHVEVAHTHDLLYAHRVSTSAVLSPQTPPQEIAANSYEPEAATYPDGSFIVGMTTVLVRNDLYGFGTVQRFDASGAAVGEPIKLRGSSFRVRSVTLHPLPDGGFLAGYVYAQDESTEDFDAPPRVATTYVERFTREGVSITGPVALDVGPAEAHRVGVGRDGAGVVAYLQQPAIELGFGPFFTGELPGEVHFRRLTVAGTRLDGAELYVNGADGNDHIIVERVRDRLWVNVNGIVEGFNAADVQFLSISGLGGDDDVVDTSGLQCT
ncbi:MAG TPA: hypothetical protein VGR35_02030, partial [Tepidisphaeraceae bacterium]|nr:hypothetical protein [Tepidisphaeraceae bacterium]